MTNHITGQLDNLSLDIRFVKAVSLFNTKMWYEAHDLFEEIWFETIGPERKTIQGLLQIAVAQLHIEKGNLNGATILYGEAIGRLRSSLGYNLGIDINKICDTCEYILINLQAGINIEMFDFPIIEYLKIDSTCSIDDE